MDNYLDQPDIASSQREQNAAFARNPVIPNKPAPAPADPGDPTGIGASQAVQNAAFARNPVVPNSPPPPGGYSPLGGNPLDNGSTLASAARKVSNFMMPGGSPWTAEAPAPSAAPKPTVAISGEVRRPLDGWQSGSADRQADGNRSAVATGPRDTDQYVFDPAQARGGASNLGGVDPAVRQANDEAGAKLAVMNANEAAARDRGHAINMLGNAQRQASYDNSTKAQHDWVDQTAEKNYMEWTLNNNPRALAAYKASVQNGGRGTTINNNAAGVAIPGSQSLPENNYLQGALAQNEAGSKALQQRLATQKSQQELQAVAQGIQKGALDVKSAERMQAAVDALHNAKTDQDRETATQNLLAMQGHNPQEWDLKTIGGREVMGPDGTVSTVGGYAAAIHKRTGEVKLYGQPKDQLAQAGGPPPEWMEAARKHNPGMSDTQLAAAYKPR